jgi:hypothetical protein
MNGGPLVTRWGQNMCHLYYYRPYATQDKLFTPLFWVGEGWCIPVARGSVTPG